MSIGARDRAPWKYRGQIGAASVYTWGNTRAIVELHAAPFGWHLSVSCSYRLPTYEEVKSARYALIPPQTTMAMVFPPPEEFVNLHKYCLHLHEAPGDKLLSERLA